LPSGWWWLKLAYRSLIVSVLGVAAFTLMAEGSRSAPVSQETGSSVPVAEIRGVINPVMAGYVDRVITAAEIQNAPLVVFTMDTPGGLDTSMRDITQRILRSRVPVAVFVSPNGARAGSAGVFISYSAHVAAMAPSTNIGSAHPVALGGGQQDAAPTPSVMDEKVINDAAALIRSLAEMHGRNPDWAEQAVRESANLPASDALRMNVIDLIASDVPDLLAMLDGRTVQVAGRPFVLATRAAMPEERPMTAIERLFHVISDPTIAYMLLSLGGLALVYELANPGAILPGVVGGIALLLALFSLGTLPINYAGVGLVLFALLLFLADLLIGGSGFLTIGGIVSFGLGSLLLATAPGSDAFVRVSVPATLATTAAVTALFVFIAAMVFRTQRRPAYSGREALIGGRGVARTEVGSDGTVLVEGELWQASANDPSNPILEGQRVRVVSVDGLHLTVRPDEVGV
jgi:membrane-bound serine protease (ClpP class)